MFFNTFEGTRSVDRDQIAAARLLGASELTVLRTVVIPSALAWVFASLTPAVSFALIGVIVGEFIGAERGLGKLIIEAEARANAAEMMVAIFVMMIVGIVLALRRAAHSDVSAALAAAIRAAALTGRQRCCPAEQVECGRVRSFSLPPCDDGLKRAQIVPRCDGGESMSDHDPTGGHGADHDHAHGHSHSHGHGHDHDHHDHGSELSEIDLRVRALESLMIEKGYVDPAALDAIVDTYETKIGPRNGAAVVAHAWIDPAFRARLLADATSAIAELGYTGRQGEHMVAVANTPTEHNMVVCTLCSCYPWPVLGVPPVWYKSAAYRSRVVIDPRGVLADFRVSLPPEKKIRVWDSTAEIRYLVIPERPAGTEGWDEARLATLVTRDSMIGTGLPLTPADTATEGAA